MRVQPGWALEGSLGLQAGGDTGRAAASGRQPREALPEGAGREHKPLPHSLEAQLEACPTTSDSQHGGRTRGGKERPRSRG